MRPAFRSNKSAVAFCALLLFLLALPVLLAWVGPPSREQNFISMSNNAGPVGFDATQMYGDTTDSDVVIIGSSRVLLGLRPAIIRDALSAHLGRPAHVGFLPLNWPGEDMRAYMLRDYLDHHHTRLVIWNIPQYKAFNNQPHVQSDLWMIYGQHEGELSRLTPLYRLVVYGEMIFGAPREVLSRLRPNLIGDYERDFGAYARYTHEDPEHKLGYMGAPFVPDSLPDPSPNELYLIPDTSPLLRVAGPEPKPYQLRFIHEFADVVKEHGATLVLLHMPESIELGDTTMPEITSWPGLIGADHSVIGAPASVLFAGVSRERQLHFYADDLHFNNNGAIWFTKKIVPSILAAYDQAGK